MSRVAQEYICSGYITLSRLGHGVLYPLFQAKDVNVSFIQEVGRDGEITGFFPFYDHDAFCFFSAQAHIARRVRDVSIYAFLDTERNLVEVDYEQIGKLARLESEEVTNPELPILTRFALARIGRAYAGRQLQYLEEFSTKFLRSSLSSRVLRASHVRNDAQREQVWDRIDAEGNEGPKQSENEFSAFETEFLFRWLYNNFHDEKWGLALRTLLRRVIYDERVFELITRLLTSEEFSLQEAAQSEKIIIGRGLELYAALKSSSNDFSEAMYEYIVNGDIFSLSDIVGPRIITTFVEYMDDIGKLDFWPIDIYIDQLRSETISPELANHLLDEIVASSALRSIYPDNSFYADHTRLDILKHIVKSSGRIGLVVDAKRRRAIQRIPVVEPR